ncbi:MAG: riboflavin synthase [Acidimicrobiales bacterium]
MFTGIVEEVGRLRRADPGPPAARLTFEAEVVLVGTQVGDSIAVDGCCLSVVELGENWWAAEAVDETLGRTTLGSLSPGDPVNLERSLATDGRLGGHWVTGHVDGVGRILSPAPDLEVEVPERLRRYLAGKGSVAVDGISLTVVEPTERGFTAAVIPHTMVASTLGAKKVGSSVNLEADLIAKYVERLLGAAPR